MCMASRKAFQKTTDIVEELKNYNVMIKRADFARAANRLGFVQIVRNDDLHVVIASDAQSRREMIRFGIGYTIV